MQKFCQWLMRLMGWKIIGSLPPLKKYVLIVAPHTSNWDLPIGLLARFAVGVRINFIAKHQIFFFPLGNFIRAVGGEPVERSTHHNRVQQVVDLFNEKETFVFGLAPEGTRSPVKRWKYGFYHIAYQAKVPIVMGAFDYKTKEIRLEKPFEPSGDLPKDFAMISKYYQNIHGKYPKDIPDYVE